MIVEKTAAKKSLAVTLALALGLSALPVGAWSQVIANVAPAAAAAGAEAGASAIAGAQTINFSVPSLAISAVAGAPEAALSVPAAAPAAAPAAFAAPAAVEAHPVIGLINQLQKAGVALPETMNSYEDAAKVEAAARALPEGSSSRAQLTQLAAAIRASRAGESGGDKSGALFDGSAERAAADAAPA
ncbi:MAG: hypothetical protein KGM24_00810, partial [Elusimicrobia bacterium]|nr:hypothetical protein [Elusimicrobiota bacterium]